MLIDRQATVESGVTGHPGYVISETGEATEYDSIGHSIGSSVVNGFN